MAGFRYVHMMNSAAHEKNCVTPMRIIADGVFFINVMKLGFSAGTLALTSAIPLYSANSFGGYSLVLNAVTRTVARRIAPPI